MALVENIPQRVTSSSRSFMQSLQYYAYVALGKIPLRNQPQTNINRQEYIPVNRPVSQTGLMPRYSGTPKKRTSGPKRKFHRILKRR